jgi:glucokinase
MKKYCIGIDLGGSFIKVGLLDGEFNPGEAIELPTPQNGQCGDVVAQMAAAARKLMALHNLSRDNIVGVGIGTPGPLKISEGIIIETPNIPGIRNLPIRDLIAGELALPAVLENDANAAGYGEFICGTGKGVQNMVLLTLGTGVGGGVVIDGRVLHGAHEIGAELGHMIVVPGGEKCNCGQLGCLERYSSATFMALRTQKLLEQPGTKSSLQNVLKTKGTITSKDINDARRAGDALAVEAWDQCSYYLAIACVNIARLFDPDEIVLGGGMAKAGLDLLEPVRAHFAKMNWTLTESLTTIDLARLGNDAGFIGAAGVAWAAFGPAK